MTPIALLLSLFDNNTVDVSLAALEDQIGADVVQEMTARSLFQVRAKVEEAPCFACDHPGHLVPVRWDGVAGMYWAWCPSAKRYAIPAAACETLRFSPANFTRELGRALNIVEWREHWVIRNVLQHVGTAQLGSRSWSLLVARSLRCATDFSRVLKLNIEGLGYERGLIIGSFSPEMSPQQRTKLYHQFRLADDLLEWRHGRIEERSGAVRHYLARSAAAPYDKRTEDVVHRILQEELEGGRAIPSGSAFRSLIRDRWPNERDPPGRTQLFKYRKSFVSSIKA